MNSWSITDKGLIRRQNQDAYFSYCDEARGVALLIVCDGMGGAAGGDQASALAVDCISELILHRLDETEKTEASLAGLLRDAVREANSLVYTQSLSKAALHGMGTTLVAAIVTERTAVVGNVGDSRAYQITPSGIRQITRDHSVVEDMVERGELTREESRHSPKKNLITRALGTDEDVLCDIFRPKVSDGDALLLCTDGLTNLMTDEELYREISGADDLEVCCESLLRQTLARGAPDNVTVTLFRK